MKELSPTTYTMHANVNKEKKNQNLLYNVKF